MAGYKGKFHVRGYKGEVPAMLKQVLFSYDIDADSSPGIRNDKFDPDYDFSDFEGKLAAASGDEEFASRYLSKEGGDGSASYAGNSAKYSRRDLPIDVDFEDPKKVEVLVKANDAKQNPFYNVDTQKSFGKPINEEEEQDARQADVNNDKTMARRKRRADAVLSGWYPEGMQDPYANPQEGLNPATYQNMPHSLGRMAPFVRLEQIRKDYKEYNDFKNGDMREYSLEDQARIRSKYEGKEKDFGALSRRFERAGGQVRIDKFGKLFLNLDAMDNAGESDRAASILKKILPHGNLEKRQADALTAHMSEAQRKEFLNNVAVLDTSNLTPDEYRQLARRVNWLTDNGIIAVNVRDKNAQSGGKAEFLSRTDTSITKRLQQLALGVLSLGDFINLLQKGGMAIGHYILSKDGEGFSDIMQATKISYARKALKDYNALFDAFGVQAAKDIEDEINKRGGAKVLDTTELAGIVERVVGRKKMRGFVDNYWDRHNKVYEKANRIMTDVSDSMPSPDENDTTGEVLEVAGSGLVPVGVGVSDADKLYKAQNLIRTVGQAFGMGAGMVGAQKLADKTTDEDEANRVSSTEGSIPSLLVSLAGGIVGGGLGGGAADATLKRVLTKFSKAKIGNSTAETLKKELAAQGEKTPEQVEREMLINNLFPKNEEGLTDEQSVFNRFMDEYITNPEWRTDPQSKDTIEFMNSMYDASGKNLARERANLASEAEKSLSNAENISVPNDYTPQQLEVIERLGLGKEDARSMFNDFLKEQEAVAEANSGGATSRDVASSFDEAINSAKKNRSDAWDKDMSVVSEANFSDAPVFDYIAEAQKEPLLMTDSELAALQKKGAKISQDKAAELAGGVGDTITPEQYKQILNGQAGGDSGLTGNQLQQLMRQIREKKERLYSSGKGQEGKIVGDINAKIKEWLEQKAASGDENASAFLKGLQNYANASSEIDKMSEVVKGLRGSSEDYLGMKDADISRALSSLSPEYAKRIMGSVPVEQQWALRRELGKNIAAKDFKKLKDVAPEELEAAFGEHGSSQFQKLMEEANTRSSYDDQLKNPNRKFSQKQLSSMLNKAIASNERGASDVADKIYAALRPTLNEQTASRYDNLISMNKYAKDVVRRGKLRTALEGGDAEGLAKAIRNADDVRRIASDLKFMKHPNAEGALEKIKSIKMSQLFRDEIIGKNIAKQTGAGRGEIVLSEAAQSFKNSLPLMKEMTTPEQFDQLTKLQKIISEAGEIDNKIRSLSKAGEHQQALDAAARSLFFFSPRRMVYYTLRMTQAVFQMLVSNRTPKNPKQANKLISKLIKKTEGDSEIWRAVKDYLSDIATEAKDAGETSLGTSVIPSLVEEDNS